MTVPLRILYNNLADIASIVSAQQAVVTMPVSNLKGDDIQELWRSRGTTTSEFLIVDFSAPVNIGAAALINTNLRSVDSGYFQMSNTDPTGQAGEAYASGFFNFPVTSQYPKLVHFLEPAPIARYMRIRMDKATPPVEAGRLVAGPVWAPTRMTAYGREKIWRDFSVRSRSLGGNIFTDIRPRQWGWRFTLRGLLEQEVREHVDEINRRLGIGKDILVCLNKDSDNLGRDTIWGLLESPAGQRQEAFNYWTVEFEVWDRV